MLFRQEPCIRRAFRHEPFADRLPHSPRDLGSVRRVSRLAEPGRTCSGRNGTPYRSLVGLLFGGWPNHYLRMRVHACPVHDGSIVMSGVRCTPFCKEFRSKSSHPVCCPAACLRSLLRKLFVSEAGQQVNRCQLVIRGEMGIAHGHRDLFMAAQFLHRADVHSGPITRISVRPG
jgi:hypothetical protein